MQKRVQIIVVDIVPQSSCTTYGDYLIGNHLVNKGTSISGHSRPLPLRIDTYNFLWGVDISKEVGELVPCIRAAEHICSVQSKKHGTYHVVTAISQPLRCEEIAFKT